MARGSTTLVLVASMVVGASVAYAETPALIDEWEGETAFLTVDDLPDLEAMCEDAGGDFEATDTVATCTLSDAVLEAEILSEKVESETGSD